MGDMIRTWHVQIDSDEGHVFFGHVVDYVDEAVLKCYGKIRGDDEEEGEDEGEVGCGEEDCEDGGSTGVDDLRVGIMMRKCKRQSRWKKRT